MIDAVVLASIALVAVGLCTANFLAGYKLAQSHLRSQSQDRPSEETVGPFTQEQSARGEPPAQAEAESKGDLTCVELQGFTSEFQTGDARNTPLAWEKRPYPTWQLMAPCGETQTQHEEFKQVLCHDICVGGISFYLPQAPTFENIVISVGPESKKLFLEARVVNFRSIPVNDEPGFLLGCRFVRRLGPFSSPAGERAARQHALALDGTSA